MRYVTYLRVSTDRQDYGLDAQRNAVFNFVSLDSSSIIAEFIEKASGKDDQRPELAKALRLAKKEGATLLIAKLDRVSRRVSFIASLMESGIPLKVADMPNADTFQLHIYAAMAEEERRRIALRTKEGLQAAKAKGVKLGVNGKELAKENKRKADTFAKDIEPLIREAVEQGIESSHKIASYLNEKGVTSPRDKAVSNKMVLRVRERLS